MGSIGWQNFDTMGRLLSYSANIADCGFDEVDALIPWSRVRDATIAKVGSA